MFNKIRIRIERELKTFVRDINTEYRLSTISGLLYKGIQDFVLRPGKRIRPVLFVVGYLGFSHREKPGLYRSAVALELLHDFLLIHDDIIDKSDTRRGKPSMHVLLQRSLGNNAHRLKFNGEDLAIVAGDVLYALAIHAFLSIDEDPRRKEQALKKFILSAMHTGGGEFIELLYSRKGFNRLDKKDIYKVYDLKTASYSFASPLTTGAILAGASPKQQEAVFRYGISLGRAFQIKDDVISLFDDEEETGKPALCDLQEGKKTLLVWHAYHHSSSAGKKEIEGILTKKKVTREDLLAMRRILIGSGALDYARAQIHALIKQAKNHFVSSGIKKPYRLLLDAWSKKLLAL
ncbi:MAG: polyprenyl synthetase family protein [Candidatus Omnitrophica bacterium]|nr:polyprenyl synthetase family protein [Candidatus Omnitrophota bacterium]